jgi:hypothetical protein
MCIGGQRKHALETNDQIKALTDSLDEQHQALLGFKCLNGLTYEEISQMYIPVRTVKGVTGRIITQLRLE